MTSEVAHLSNKNEELCQELTEIDHLAQQLERHKEIVLETADKEIGEAKVRKFQELLDRISRICSSSLGKHSTVHFLSQNIFCLKS